jgi:hypothetical protein
MSRQNCVPLLIGPGSATPLKLPLHRHQPGATEISEADIQGYVHTHPACLPIEEIDPIFAGPVSICRELSTSAGPIDVFMVTPSGLPVLVECKLWRNPEARREVVGQILDYAKELSRWSSSDLQRAVKQRLKHEGNPLLELVRAVHPEVDEIRFNDALTKNLRRGRFLLLIVGDGIREGVEAIAEYVQAHAGLHFSLGLVEMPIYVLPDGGRLIVPRVLARTAQITRTVVAMPDGFTMEEAADAAAEDTIDRDRQALSDEQQRFWKEFLEIVRLDDPEQQIPGPARLGHIRFTLPAPNGSAWITVYRDVSRGMVGVFLASSRNTAGEHAMLATAEDWDAVRCKLGGHPELVDRDTRPTIRERRVFGPLKEAEVRKEAFPWLAERLNAFVNVLRPRVRSAVADYASTAE